MELLGIVQAEQSAEALLREAQDHKVSMLKQAQLDREFKLSNIQVPKAQVPQLRMLNPKLDALKETARRNKQRAVKLILEDIYAS